MHQIGLSACIKLISKKPSIKKKLYQTYYIKKNCFIFKLKLEAKKERE